MFGAETVCDRPEPPAPSGAMESEVDEYRPVPARVREREEAMETEREERREEGGAYCEDGSGGYGSTMRTSWTEEVPKPGRSALVSRQAVGGFQGRMDGPLNVTSTSGFQSLMPLSPRSSSGAPDLGGVGRASTSGSSRSVLTRRSGSSARTESERDRVRDRR